MMTPLEQIAAEIAGRVMSEHDVRKFGIDTKLILVIVRILTELAPIVVECLDDDEEDVSQSVRKFVSYRGPGWRWRQMRLRRTIRTQMVTEYGRDVPSGFVRDIEREILRAGTIPEYANVFAMVA